MYCPAVIEPNFLGGVGIIHDAVRSCTVWNRMITLTEWGTGKDLEGSGRSV
jgi:hypothetical protein